MIATKLWARAAQLLTIISMLACSANGLLAQTVLRFDDLAQAVPGLPYTPFTLAEQYAGLGVHFTPTNAGVQDGLANGDAGNWAVDGTNGAFFLGFNGNPPDVTGSPSYGDTITFDSSIATLSMDVSRANGSSAGDTFQLQAFAASTLVSSQSITFGAINSWTTVTVAGPGITSVILQGNGVSSFHPFGVDNIVFSAVPEPPTAVLLLSGLIMACAGWRRRTCRS
jgi:hypothetical protein